MAESPLEISSDAEMIKTLQGEKEWLTAITAVLLQEAGGVVEISNESLMAIDLRKTQIILNKKENSFTIEGVFNELE